MPKKQVKNRRPKGTGTIFQIGGKGSFYYRNTTNGIKQVSLKTTEHNEAVAKVRERFGIILDLRDEERIEKKLLNNLKITQSEIEDSEKRKIPLEDIYNEFIKILTVSSVGKKSHVDADKETRLSKGALENYQSHLNQFIEWLATYSKSIVTMDNVDAKVAVDYHIYLKNKKIKKKKKITKPKPATIRRHLIDLRNVWKRLKIIGDLKTNPFDVLEMPSDQEIKESESPKEPFSQKQIEAILEKATGWMIPAIFIAYYSGLRISDIVTLKWADIDFKTQFIDIQTRKGSKDQLFYIPEAIDKILNWKKKCDSKDIYVFQEQSETFFGERKYLNSARIKNKDVDKKADRSHASKEFMDFLKDECKINVTNKDWETVLGFHSFRVTWATNNKLAGGKLDDIKSQLGHSNSRTTKGYIQTIIEDRKNQLIKKHITVPILVEDFDELREMNSFKSNLMSVKANNIENLKKKIIKICKAD